MKHNRQEIKKLLTDYASISPSCYEDSFIITVHEAIHLAKKYANIYTERVVKNLKSSK